MNRRVSPVEGYRKELFDALDEADIEGARTRCSASWTAERHGERSDLGRLARDGLGGGDAPLKDEAGGTEGITL